jgi:hypothetical protein
MAIGCALDLNSISKRLHLRCRLPVFQCCMRLLILILSSLSVTYVTVVLLLVELA